MLLYVAVVPLFAYGIFMFVLFGALAATLVVRDTRYIGVVAAVVHPYNPFPIFLTTIAVGLFMSVIQCRYKWVDWRFAAFVSLVAATLLLSYDMPLRFDENTVFIWIMMATSISIPVVACCWIAGLWRSDDPHLLRRSSVLPEGQ
jgi:hypothetical protein